MTLAVEYSGIDRLAAGCLEMNASLRWKTGSAIAHKIDRNAHEIVVRGLIGLDDARRLAQWRIQELPPGPQLIEQGGASLLFAPERHLLLAAELVASVPGYDMPTAFLTSANGPNVFDLRRWCSLLCSIGVSRASFSERRPAWDWLFDQYAALDDLRHCASSPQEARTDAALSSRQPALLAARRTDAPDLPLRG